MIVIWPILIFLLIIMPFYKSVMNFIRFTKGKEEGLVSAESLLDIEEEKLIESSAIRTHKMKYEEILFMGISPLAGMLLVYIFSSEIKPINVRFAPSIGLIVVIAWLSYWISRLAKSPLRVKATLILQYGMALGMLLYFFLALHFISPMVVMGAGFLPFFAFPMFAPIPALLYNIRMIQIQNNRINEQLIWQEQNNIQPEKVKWYRRFMWEFKFPNFMALFAVLILVQLFLLLFGQPIGSMVYAFAAGEGFLFSGKPGDMHWADLFNL